MTRPRWLFLLFWVFVIGMLLKQCNDDTVRRQDVSDHTEKHFFFTAPPGQKLPEGPAASPHADVEQIFYAVQPDTPNEGYFTCQVTVKNLGDLIARNVTVEVRPFRGGRTGTDNMGHTHYGILGDNDPMAQLSASLSFPDLAPGQQSTQSTVFLKRDNVEPGPNPKPLIGFDSGKANP